MSDRYEDNSKVSGQLIRAAKVGGAMAGLGARLAGARYLGVGIDKDRHAEQLKTAIGGLKGPLMKVAQILATIPDALPKEYAEELRQLQTNAPSMGWPFVRRRMATELGPSWQSRFGSFEREAAHAASLGQVHRGTLTDGTPVACKLQYPDMASAIDSDLRQLKMIFSLYERYDKAISTARIHEELAERLREELDYAREAKAMRLYAQILKDEPRVTVPEPVADLSTRRLLTMTWLDGKPLLDFKDAPQDVRNDIALALFRAWYVPFYGYGVIHGDPHLGNYAVREDSRSINLLDFGCIRIFPPAFVGGVIDLYHALRTNDDALAVHAYESWGFTNLSKEMLEVLNIWARFLYSPLMEDKVQKIQEADNGLYGAQIAGKVRAELSKLGGVEPPREFVLVDRAAIGLGSVFMHLRATVNWHRLFHELIDGFSVQNVEKNQKAATSSVAI
ncbi:AarF/ABC1/UbiB kinase family protein [Rhodospirillaceae bacterium KN72]|uniref:AarF/ABC1/UbiB kinase family protein n=1 Tax=Pacificispira spongiicola TaxID=2729598 RepID=A0A7Y0DXL7_9PROT|nr:AarF/ABC1/UbiB kinase family protein [Pacificispira spongiicola]NMM43484.1 AarF/ABC1/UbiB kinase family protein [Pacificispira spongiicola]